METEERNRNTEWVSSNAVDIQIGYVFDINLDFYSYRYSNLLGSMLVKEIREREVFLFIYSLLKRWCHYFR
jgi:hypothetical protein